MDATLPLALPLTLFALGLASGLHCLGMCGGIVTAFSTTRVLQPRARLLPNQLLFNAGRIASYSAAGLVAGATGALFHGSSVLYIAVNVLLVFVGLHLVGLRTPLQWLERLGAPLWRRLAPLAARAFNANAFAGGLLWGLIPCALVYGALGAAALGGSPARGAAAMAAFGLGTLPWLLAAGVAAARLRGWIQRRPVRAATGSLVAAYGAWGLAHSLIIGGHT
jgi:sulfite exporter TauE/SafE